MTNLIMKLTLTIVLLCSASLASAENWVEATKSRDRSVAVYIDTDSVKKTSEGAAVWMRTITRTNRMIAGKKYRDTKVRATFDCKNRLIRQESVRMYADKEVLVFNYQYSGSEQTWDYIVPNTLGDKTTSWVCSRYH